MKGRISLVLFAATLYLCPVVSYAEEKRMDKAMMTALCQLAQYCSYLVLVIALGMLFLSYRSENGDMKVNALKLFGAFVLLFALLPLAKAAGFAY